MKLTHDYLGHAIKVSLNGSVKEVIFCGWFLEVPLVQMLDDDGYLTGDIHAIEEKNISDLPPLIGEPPAIYCAPRN